MTSDFKADPELPVFVPLLTEIVEVANDRKNVKTEFAKSPDAGFDKRFDAVNPTPSTYESAIAGSLSRDDLRGLGADLDRLIATAIAHALDEQMPKLRAQIEKTVADTVQEALWAAVAELERKHPELDR